MAAPCGGRVCDLYPGGRPMLDDVLTALGATAEMCRLFYKNLIEQGFTQKDALELTKEFIRTTLTPKKD